jgi:hypothetical protein
MARENLDCDLPIAEITMDLGTLTVVFEFRTEGSIP